MKPRLYLLIVFLTIAAVSLAQPASPWAKWSWLIGEWKGEGSGEPGKGTGGFSFKPDLTEKILVRRDHSEYPTTDKSPATIHDGLMIIYLDNLKDPSKAIYFDNEGHTINYSISYADKSIVLLSEKIPNAPLFRLTYSLIENETVNTKFEMSMDGEKFMTYVEGKSKKVK